MIKKYIFIIFYLLFLVLSIVFISSKSKQTAYENYSDNLQQRIVEDEIISRIDYINEGGEITFAEDLGYSTKVIRKLQGSELEEYYDSDGAQVYCSLGCYAVLREYDDQGNNIRVEYLDDDYNPINIIQGYASEINQFDDQGRKVYVKYFDTLGNPVCSVYDGYAKKLEYNTDGKITKISYYDQFGNLMITSNGYAIVNRSYYSTNGPENGKIAYEFYFDTQENPIALFLGQYGVYKEYYDTGENMAFTYLNADGRPIVTKRGYTIVSRTYHDNGYSDMYYDIDGNPFQMPDGQYGVKKENGQIVYLNINGEEQFSLKVLYNNRSYFVVLSASVVMLLSFASSKRVNKVLILLYCLAIIYFTLLYRESGFTKTNFDLFSNYKRFFANDEIRSSILKNIWLFIPLGSILFSIYPQRKAILFPALLSFMIEIIQYITNTGWYDIDDVISNVLGSILGFVLCKVITELMLFYTKDIPLKSININYHKQ